MIRYVCILCIALFPVYSHADDETSQALAILDKMSDATRSLNYYGVLVYLHDGQMESMQLVHKRDASGEYERLVHLSGIEREVIRANNIVTCYLSDTRSIVVGERHFNNGALFKLASNFDKYVGTYAFEVDGIGRIAGKKAQVVVITPKDHFRYGYRMWIATDSGLLLQTELLDVNGKILEKIMFAQLDIVDDIPQSMLEPTISKNKFVVSDARQATQKNREIDSGWWIKNLPAGFELSGHFKQMMPNSEQAAEHMVITDGLAAISVYIETFNAQSQAFVGSSQMGAVNIFGSIFDDYQVTVVGEVPESTVRQIAESIQYSSNK